MSLDFSANPVLKFKQKYFYIGPVYVFEKNHTKVREAIQQPFLTLEVVI
jgi:hypothetical protein